MSSEGAAAAAAAAAAACSMLSIDTVTSHQVLIVTHCHGVINCAPVLSCPVLSCPVLSCPVLLSPVSSLLIIWFCSLPCEQDSDGNTAVHYASGVAGSHPNEVRQRQSAFSRARLRDVSQVY